MAGSYSHPLSDQLDMFVRGELNLQSGYYGYIDDSSYAHMPSTVIANLRMGARIQNLEISLWVENISDERTFTGMIPAPPGSAGYLAGPGLPRLWGVTLRSSVGDRAPVGIEHNMVRCNRDNLKRLPSGDLSGNTFNMAIAA